MTVRKFVTKEYLYIHQALRKDLQAFEEATSKLNNLTETTKLAEWFEFFWDRIEEQHSAEDEIAFPQVATRSAAFSAQLPTLIAEHQKLSELLEEIGQTFDLIQACKPRERPAHYRQLYLLAMQLRLSLQAHLDREERIYIPAVALYFSPAEQIELQEQLRQAHPEEALELVLPWILSGTNEQEQEKVLMELPWHLRLAHRVSWQKKYQRLVAPLYRQAAAG